MRKAKAALSSMHESSSEKGSIFKSVMKNHFNYYGNIVAYSEKKVPFSQAESVL